jgi:hypothetical protein
MIEPSRMAEEHRITTVGGRFHVRWDENGSASALGPLAFFAELLEVTGLFERRAKHSRCPVSIECSAAITGANSRPIRSTRKVIQRHVKTGKKTARHAGGNPKQL